jgi:hypothetical protein
MSLVPERATSPLAARFLMGALVAILLATSTPARAEFPFALRTNAGFGGGGGERSGLTIGGFAPYAGAELSWRPQPGHEWVLSYDRGAVWSSATRLVSDPVGDMHFRVTDRTGYEAVLLGIGRANPGSGFHRFFQAGIGVGRIFDGWGPPSIGTDGLALGASAGFRFVPAPGPVGFVIGVRTSHVFAGPERVHTFALTLGLTVHPAP